MTYIIQYNPHHRDTFFDTDYSGFLEEWADIDSATKEAHENIDGNQIHSFRILQIETVSEN